MTRRITIAVLVLAAFAAGLRADRVFPAATEATRYVSVSQCLRAMPEFEQGLQALQVKYQGEAVRLQELATSFKAQEMEIAQLAAGSPAATLAELRLQSAKEAATREAEYLSRRQGAEADALLDAAVRRIHGAVAAVGEREGFSAMLMKPGDLIDLKQATIMDSLDDLEGRWVMWSHPDHDVTELVLAVLAEQG
jgi:Skp family chaperone for outer membrane proteins